jgi:hypothetical protein
MIITKLQGGFGNQLFQYAAGIALSYHHNVELRIGISSFEPNSKLNNNYPRNFSLHELKGFNEQLIDENTLISIKKYPFLKQSFWQKLLPNHKRNVYKEPFFHYDPNFLKGKKNQYLIGYWQSEQYFLPIIKIIQEKFQLKDELTKHLLTVKNKIKINESLAVHVRRGDYLQKPEILDWHGVLTKEYYVQAFNKIQQKTKIDSIYYFTDDFEWVQEELLPILGGEIVSNLITKNATEDFYLMQHCKHNIIANSSFSWWAAYLNPNPDKMIIAPKKWFDKAPINTKDLCPPSWIRI